MNGATLQGKLYYGYAKSAQYIGLPFTQYRPTGASSPLANAPLQTLNASFNAEDMTYSKPRGYAKATWYALVDGSQTKVFDYLVSTDGLNTTYFIAAMQPVLPILAVRCNAVVTVTRPQLQTQFGDVQDYEGTTASNETVLMTGWPCSLLQGTKGEKGEVTLPGDVRNMWAKIILPSTPGVTLRMGDIVADNLERRFIVSSAELTDLGWQLTAQQGQT